MESSEQDLARAKQYLMYIIEVHGGHDFCSFFGECPCGVVMEYWKASMHNRLDDLYARHILPLNLYNGGVCEYSEV